jgi:hypothetical protein
MRGDRAEFRIVHRDGGKPKTLVPGQTLAQSWLKDGKSIVALGPYRKAWPDSREKVDGIVLVDAASERTTVVKQSF